MNLIGESLETARQRFLENNGSYYDRLVKSSRSSVQTWLDIHDNSFIDDAVAYAAREHRIDSHEILEELKTSMRFRALAGMMHQQVEYDPDDPMGGPCANLVENEDGTQDCEVPNNQAQADKYHSIYGHTPSCPFHKPANQPPEEGEKLTSLSELDDDTSLEEAFRQANIGRIKGI